MDRSKYRALLKEVSEDWNAPITSDDILVISASLCLLTVPVAIVMFGG